MWIDRRLVKFLAAVSVAWGLPAAAAAHGLEIETAWVSEKPAAGADHTAYLTIANEAFHPEYLYKASTSVAARVELHKVSAGEKMVAVARMEIPLDDRLDMRKTGYHLMLIGVKRALVPGEEIPLMLVFGDNQVQKTKIRVGNDG